MSKYILSPEAQKSLKQIKSYSVKNYGAQQAKIYLKMLRDHMRHVANKPDSNGTARNEIKKEYYSIFAGKHTIYYRIRNTYIDIIDILHQRMDPEKHL